MNELKILMWLEWKKSPGVVSALLTVLGLMLGVILFGSTIQYAYEIAIMGLMVGFGYLLGLVFLVIFAFRLGKDFKSDEFTFLLMSPAKPWKHIVARLLFACGLLGAYFAAIAALVMSFVFKFWTGGVGVYLLSVFVALFQHLTIFIIPLVSFVLLTAIMVASVKQRSRLITQMLMVVALWVGLIYGSKPLMETNATIFPKLELNLDNTLAFDKEILNQMILDGHVNLGQNDDPDNPQFSLNGEKLEFGGNLPILIEPQILMLMFSVLSLLGTIRIWNEVEL